MIDDVTASWTHTDEDRPRLLRCLLQSFNNIIDYMIVTSVRRFQRMNNCHVDVNEVARFYIYASSTEHVRLAACQACLNSRSIARGIYPIMPGLCP